MFLVVKRHDVTADDGLQGFIGIRQVRQRMFATGTARFILYRISLKLVLHIWLVF